MNWFLDPDTKGELVPGTYTEVGRIKWKTWSSDRIVYGGSDMKREEFMPNAGRFSWCVITVRNL